MSRSSDLIEEATRGLTFVSKRMFGGVGYFTPQGGIFAAIVTQDDLVLKFTLGAERDELIALGAEPWVYEGSGRKMTMQEWLVVPEAFYDDSEQLQAWVRRAHRLAPAKKPRPPRKGEPQKAPAKQERRSAKKATSAQATKPSASNTRKAIPKKSGSKERVD